MKSSNFKTLTEELLDLLFENKKSRYTKFIKGKLAELQVTRPDFRIKDVDAAIEGLIKAGKIKYIAHGEHIERS